MQGSYNGIESQKRYSKKVLGVTYTHNIINDVCKL